MHFRNGSPAWLIRGRANLLLTKILQLHKLTLAEIMAL